MLKEVVPLLFAAAVAFVEYLSKSYQLRDRQWRGKLLSFSAGVSATYILLEMIPFFTESAFFTNRFLFFALLVGFVSHHIIEKEIYQHNKNHDLIKKLNFAEHVFYFFYHSILGVLLVAFVKQSLLEGIFFAISISAYTIASNLPATPHRSKQRMGLLSTATFLGGVIAVLVPPIPATIEFTLFGLVTGVLLFTVTRHHIPYGRKGNVYFFVFGCVLYSLLIIGKWFI